MKNKNIKNVANFLKQNIFVLLSFGLVLGISAFGLEQGNARASAESADSSAVSALNFIGLSPVVSGNIDNSKESQKKIGSFAINAGNVLPSWFDTRESCITPASLGVNNNDAGIETCLETARGTTSFSGLEVDVPAYFSLSYPLVQKRVFVGDDISREDSLTQGVFIVKDGSILIENLQPKNSHGNRAPNTLPEKRFVNANIKGKLKAGNVVPQKEG